MEKIVKIQALFRGYILRSKRLPIVMYKIQKYMKSIAFQFSYQTDDGRINSCLDEKTIIELLVKKFGDKIKRTNIRMWYDILVFDYIYGWLPINIKTTTTLTCDNTSNLSMCVYAYTNVVLDFNKKYNNGDMSKLFFNKMKVKHFNKINKKDYYFLVVNKHDNNDIIINSVKGLMSITPNVNNLPFQVCWNKNRYFIYEPIHNKIKLLIDCLQKANVGWKEKFIKNIKTLKF